MGPLLLSGSKSDPQGACEAEIPPWGRARRNPALEGRTRRTPPRGTRQVGAHALGLDDADTSSSESDEAWPGP